MSISNVNVSNQTLFHQEPLNGQTLLYKAAQDGDLGDLKKLLESGSDPNQQDNGGRTALFAAALGNHEAVFQTLLDHKTSWECTDNLGNTVFHVVSDLGYEPLAALLIRAGASPLLLDSRGRSPICLAIQAYVENKVILDPHSSDMVDWEKDYRQQWEILITTLLQWEGWNEQEDKCWRFAKYLYQKSQDTQDFKLCARFLLRPVSSSTSNDSILQSYTDLLSKCVSHPQEALQEYEDTSSSDRNTFFPLRLRHLACILGLEQLYVELTGPSLNTMPMNRSQQEKETSQDMLLTARFGQIDMFESLATSYSYRGEKDDLKRTILCWAARNGDLRLLECLLKLDYYAPIVKPKLFDKYITEQGKRVSQKKVAKAIQVSFVLASAQTFIDCFQPSAKLVAYDQETLKEADINDSVLVEHLPNHDSVARLLYEKYSPMLKCTWQRKPLSRDIIRKKYQRIVQQRMVSHISLDTLDEHGLALVHYGAINGWHKFIERLQKNSANLAKRTNRDSEWSKGGNYAVSLACKSNQWKLAETLFFNGCKPTPRKYSIEPTIPPKVHSSPPLESRDSEYLDKEDKFGRTPLYCAVERKKWRKARILLGRGANPNIATFSGMSLLHLPMSSAFLQELIANGCKTDKVTESGLTILHAAADRGDIECLKVALEYGVDVNAVTKNKDTALHFAVQKSHLAAVMILLEWGAYINAKNSRKETPLHQAAVIEESRILWALCLNGANLDKADASKNTALHRAAKKGKLKQVNLLVKYSADPNTLNSDGYSPLELVIVNDVYYKVAEALIKSNLVNSEVKENAFHVAAFYGRVAVARYMFHKTNANERYSWLSEGTPLHYAAEKGHNAFVIWLLEKYPKKLKQQALLSEDESGHTPLFLAAKNGHQTVVETLSNACNLKKEMVLHVVKPFLKAVQNGHPKVVEVFLKNNHTKDLIARDLNRKESRVKSSLPAKLLKSNGSAIAPLMASPKTALYVRSLLPDLWKQAIKHRNPQLALNVAFRFHFSAERPKVGALFLASAIEMRWERVFEALLNKGADPVVSGTNTLSAWQLTVKTEWKEGLSLLISHKNSLGVHPQQLGKQHLLHIAVQQRWEEGLSLLIDVVDIHALDDQGNSALDYAFSPTFCLEIAMTLIQKGARASALSDGGAQAMQEMAKNKQWDLMKKLIATGADIPASAQAFPEILVSLTRGRQYELAECMLKGGASPSIAITEDSNRTPLHYAVIRNDHQMIQLLLNYQADRTSQDKFGLTPAQLAEFLNKEEALRHLS